MNRFTVCLITVLCLVFSTGLAFAGGDSDTCATKYPIVLSHGMGAHADNLGIGYWYNIPGTLEDEGADVYISDQMAMQGTAYRAQEVKAYVQYVLAVTGKSKVNIIGHSHGTLDTRYMISNMGMASKVASYTSIAGPHRGSSVADVVLGVLPDSGEWLVSGLVNTIYDWIFGDASNSIQGARDLSTSYMKNVFNPNTPNMSGIYYQSWSAKIKLVTADFLIAEPTWLLMKFYEGDNDCLVSVSSSKWGTYRGIQEGAWWCGGVSHFNIVDQFLGITPGFDAPQFYVDVVSELKNKGY
jgi:triacylglycerol lipase